MSNIDDLRKHISNLDSEQAQTEQQRAEVYARRSDKMNELRREILKGGSTGDDLLDAVIINYRSTDLKLVGKLRTIEAEIAAHPNELIMVVERDIHQFVHRGPMGGPRPGDFGTTEEVKIGLLNGSTLVVKPLGKDDTDVKGFSYLAREPDHRQIGFPTSGYIVNPALDPHPVVILGDLFTSSDPIYAYRQPLRSPGDDWDQGMGFPGGGMALPMFPSPRPGGNQLDVYVGDEAVEKQNAMRSILRPLYLWWVRRALGQDAPMTPTITEALAKFSNEYLKKIQQLLVDLEKRKRSAKIIELEGEIRTDLERLKRFDIELTPELKEQLAQHHLPPP